MECTIEFALAFDWKTLLRLTLAAILGGIEGAERELSGRPAGLRTNTLIAVGSCLFTILSNKALPSLTGNAQKPPGVHPRSSRGRFSGRRRCHSDEKISARVYDGGYHLDGGKIGYSPTSRSGFTPAHR